jgi:DNA-binding transcriptional LysR family regulator
MRLDRLDMNLLAVLDALLEERSVTRAAKRLRLSQPATSNARARLRQYFGDPLVTQMGRQMVLTPFARELEDPVRDVMLQIRAIANARTAFDPGTARRRFSVNVSDYVALFLMKPVMRHLAEVAPAVVVELDPASEGMVERFERGNVDMVIAPEFLLARDHPSTFLFEETYCCVAWAGNDAVGDTLSLQEYQAAEHVMLNLRLRSSSIFEQYCHNIVGWCPSHTMLPQFVTGTRRLATVHRRVAERYAGELELRMLPLPFKVPPLVEHLQWHRFADDDPAARWFRGVLTAFASRI